MRPASVSELDLLVLTLVEQKPCHGYLLVKQLHEQCSQSAVYRSLHRLTEQQLLHKEIIMQPKTPNQHHFTLTKLGAQLIGQSAGIHAELSSRLAQAGRSYRRLQLLVQFQPLN